jgi:hypothetical protein
MRGRGDEDARNYSDTPGTRSVPGRPADEVRVERTGTPVTTPTDAGAIREDEDTTRRTREIRAEIEQTREEMSETIDAIQEKLRPGNIVSEATDRVKNATTERVRNMVDSASETAQGAMEQSREYAGEMMHGARQNAIPIAMIGAGLAWLLIERLRGDNRDRDYEYGGYRGYRADRRYDRYGESGVSGTAVPSESEPGYRTDWNQQQRARALTDRGSARWREGASTRDRMMRATRRGRSRVQHMINDNPLLVGAGALMLGAALGMALPETEAENEWMGETKETMMDRAQDMARNAASRAQNAVGDVAGEVASRVVTGKDTNQ